MHNPRSRLMSLQSPPGHSKWPLLYVGIKRTTAAIWNDRGVASTICGCRSTVVYSSYVDADFPRLGGLVTNVPPFRTIVHREHITRFSHQI